MAYTLRYQYRPGDLLRYRLTIEMVARDVSGARQEKHDESESTHRVLQADPQKGWLIEVPQKKLQFWLDPQGVTNPAVGRMTRLPAGQVDIGATWEVAESMPVGPTSALQWTYTLSRVEEEKGQEALAYLKSRAKGSETDEDGAQVTITVKGAHVFSIDQGHQVYARIITSLAWPDGRETESNVEIDLEERTPSP